VREESEAANRVAAQLLGRLVEIYSHEGGTQAVQHFLQQRGHIRSNDLALISASGETLYRSPPPTYKAGREAPAWFTHLLEPYQPPNTMALSDGSQLILQAQSSRSVLDAWDDVTHLLTIAVIMLAVANALAFWLVDRALA